MIKYLVSSLTVVVALTLTTYAPSAKSQSSEQCPAINCDCNSLPNVQWALVCNAHEDFIKNACVENGNTPKDYCLVHGLDGRPLPLTIKFSEFEVDDSINVKELDERIDRLVLNIQAGINEAREDVAEKKYKRTLQILKLQDSNIDNIFQLQQQIDAYYIAINKAKKMRRSWKKYSESAELYAAGFRDLGMDLSANIEQSQTDKERAIFSLLSRKALRIAGKGFEHSGHAYAKFNQHSKAAEAWKISSDVATSLIEINKLNTNEYKNIEFIEFQAASRLHRSSLHWLIDGNIEKSIADLRESQLFVNRDGQQNLESLVSNIEEDLQEDGILTGR
ncbi:hypothetical protein [Agarilytica rhodophyticola]|uniref:hypothetical protein n=1 Tax=Agarilytica rhodophyticola TaxID=1737490 RepID=UPI000B347993|nr:hypothetical protein [Agarilytica rhodophyticola]